MFLDILNPLVKSFNAIGETPVIKTLPTPPSANLSLIVLKNLLNELSCSLWSILFGDWFESTFKSVWTYKELYNSSLISPNALLIELSYSSIKIYN